MFTGTPSGSAQLQKTILQPSYHSKDAELSIVPSVYEYRVAYVHSKWSSL